jgi:hypothetical protein
VAAEDEGTTRRSDEKSEGAGIGWRIESSGSEEEKEVKWRGEGE